MKRVKLQPRQHTIVCSDEELKLIYVAVNQKFREDNGDSLSFTELQSEIWCTLRTCLNES